MEIANRGCLTSDDATKPSVVRCCPWQTSWAELNHCFAAIFLSSPVAEFRRTRPFALRLHQLANPQSSTL